MLKSKPAEEEKKDDSRSKDDERDQFFEYSSQISASKTPGFVKSEKKRFAEVLN